jgi:hypothetical protein
MVSGRFHSARMKANRLFLASALIALSTACVSERRPSPTPTPTTRPSPAPTTAPVAPADWRDAPLTSGDWSYRGEGVTTAALFGPPASEALFVVRCNRAARTVTLSRAGAAPREMPMSVTTTSAARTLSASPTAGQLPYLAANLAAGDPLLDAMAFSRGRVRVEVPGLPTLTLPAWPEISRVVEDCRR